jgi:hypothetical protein
MTESAGGGLSPERDPEAQQVLRRYERFFARAAWLSVLFAVAGILICIFFLTGGARAVVITALAVGGLWLAAMCLVIRRRVQTGPRGASRWGFDRLIRPPSSGP